MREQDALLAKFEGVNTENPKHYTTSDQDAVLLLPALVEKGYNFRLETDGPWIDFTIMTASKDIELVSTRDKTISAAICNAILSLPEVQAMKEE